MSTPKVEEKKTTVEKIQEKKDTLAVSQDVKKRKSFIPKYGTRYEQVYLVGRRAIEIANGKGNPIMIDLSKVIGTTNNKYKFTDPLEIAKEELKQRVLPLPVKRISPDGREEQFHVSELIWEDE